MQEEKYKKEGRTYSKRNQDLMKWKIPSYPDYKIH